MGFIYDVIDIADPGHVKVQWVPSHLDDPDNKDKKSKYLREGVTTPQHIEGNVAADAVADEGASAHNIPIDVRLEAEDRLQLTVAVQRHLVASCSQWIQHSKGIAVDADQHQIAEIADRNQYRCHYPLGPRKT